MDTELIPARNFTEVDIAMALRTMALYGGNAARTARSLEAEGKKIDAVTLNKWKNETYPVQYENIVHELREKIGSQISDGAMETAVAAMGLSAEMIARVQQNLDDIETKDLPKAALNMTQSARGNVEVARLLRNEPTSITEVRSVDESIDKLAELGIIDLPAEDVT